MQGSNVHHAVAASLNSGQPSRVSYSARGAACENAAAAALPEASADPARATAESRLQHSAPPSLPSGATSHPTWRGAPWIHVYEQPGQQPRMHRSAPRLHASYMHGQGSMDPTRPWRVGMVKTRHDVVVAKAIVTGEKHAPVVWRPPGKSEGQAVTDHRHLHGPPVPPSTDAVRNLRNETDLAALLAAAHVQLGEQRQHAALAAEEARNRLTMLRAEHASELLQLGSALELERRAREAAEQREVALTAKFADTREGRVDEYHKRAMRRMLRSELSRAWSQWLAVYEQKLYARVIARRTQAALFHVKPTVRAAFALWRTLREAMRARQAGKGLKELSRELEDLQGEIAEARAETNEVRAEGLAKVGALQKQLAALQAELEAKERALAEREHAEKAERVTIISDQASHRFKFGGLVRGWTTWVTKHREYQDKAAKAKMLRYVRQRLMKPELADPFILWKEWWEGLCRAAKGQPRTTEDLLSEEMGLRRALQDEKGALHGQLEEAQQALHLAKVALSDERRALAAARAELQDLKRIEIQARESLTKRRSADARFKELQRSQAEAMSSLERERRESQARLVAQKSSAGSELRTLLKEQRASLEAQMADALAQAEDRVLAAEARARDDARLLAAQYAAALALANERANRGMLDADSPGALSSASLPEGPRLHTRDRSVVWEQELAAREAAGLKPTDPWHPRYGVDEFRAIRRAPSKLAQFVEASQLAAAQLESAAARQHDETLASTNADAITDSLLALLEERHASTAPSSRSRSDEDEAHAAAAHAAAAAAAHAAERCDAAVDNAAAGRLIDAASKQALAGAAAHHPTPSSVLSPKTSGTGDGASSSAGASRLSAVAHTPSSLPSSLASRSSSMHAGTGSAAASGGSAAASASTRRCGFGSDSREPGARAALSAHAAGQVSPSTKHLQLQGVNVLAPTAGSSPATHSAPKFPSNLPSNLRAQKGVPAPAGVVRVLTPAGGAGALAGGERRLLENVVGSSASLLRATSASCLKGASSSTTRQLLAEE